MFKKVLPKYKLVSVEPEDVTEEDDYFNISKDYKKLVALRSFGDVKAGDFGGLVHNVKLSHNGNCWIYPKSRVSNSKVSGNATIHDSIIRKVIAKDNAKIKRANINVSETTPNMLYDWEYLTVSGAAIISGSDIDSISNSTITGHSAIRGWLEVTLYKEKLKGTVVDSGK